jgi:hypothetical protein
MIINIANIVMAVNIVMTVNIVMNIKIVMIVKIVINIINVMNVNIVINIINVINVKIIKIVLKLKNVFAVTIVIILKVFLNYYCNNIHMCLAITKYEELNDIAEIMKHENKEIKPKNLNPFFANISDLYEGYKEEK